LPALNRERLRNSVGDLAALWAVVGGAYISLAVFLWHWHYNLMRADAFGYWHRSNGLVSLYDLYHVPGYAWLIWAVRQIFGSAHPLLLMMGINILLLLAAAGAAYGLLVEEGFSPKIGVLAGFLYAFWPLTGLVFSVNPWADVPATSAFLLGWLAWKRRLLGWAVLGMAAAVLMHKSLWATVAFWWLAVWWFEMGAPRRKAFWYALLTFSPLAALWAFGVGVLHHPWNWLVAHNLQAELRPLGVHIPVFSGVVETLSWGGLRGWTRGSFLLAGLLLAVFLLIWAWRRRWWDLAAVSFGVLALYAVVNSYEALAAWRFSRLLAVPLAALVGECGWRGCQSRLTAGAIIVGSYLSQLLFAWWSVCRWAHGGWCK